MREKEETHHRDHFTTLFGEWQGIFHVRCSADRQSHSIHLAFDDPVGSTGRQSQTAGGQNTLLIFAAPRPLVDSAPTRNQTHNTTCKVLDAPSYPLERSCLGHRLKVYRIFCTLIHKIIHNLAHPLYSSRNKSCFGHPSSHLMPG